MYRSVLIVLAVALAAGGSHAAAAELSTRTARGTSRMQPQEQTAAPAGQPTLTSIMTSGRSARTTVLQREDGTIPATTTDSEPVRIATRPITMGSTNAAAPRMTTERGERRAAASRRVKRVEAGATVPLRTMAMAAATDSLYRVSSATRKIGGAMKTRTDAATRVRTASVPLTKGIGSWYQFMFDGFEGAFPGYWYREGIPTWGRTAYRRATGAYSAWCAGSDFSAGGSYLNNMNAWMIDGPFDLSTARAVEIYLDYRLSTEPYYDTLFVGVSTDGVNFHGSSYSGSSAGWLLNEKLIFDEVAGWPEVYVAVQFQSDNVGCGYEGAYVDNIELDAYLPSLEVTDLAVVQGDVVDPLLEIIGFTVSNGGPVGVAANSYAVNVYVDDALDSSARNTAVLTAGATATWEWPLAYLYAPGLHTVRVVVAPDATDPAPANNAIEFTITVPPPPPADVAPMNVAMVNALLGEFDFDVYNYGPGIVLPDSYFLAVYVDGLLDSSAWNANLLSPGGSSGWQWTLAYSYTPGAHNVVIEVATVATDPVPGNNAVAFTLNVPFGSVVANLRVYNPRITDAANDIFTFLVRNNGPNSCWAGDYFVRILVDGVLDSTDYNHSELPAGWEAKWTWQLEYIYPPGLHVVTVEVVVNGADPNLGNNSVEFSHVRPGSAFQILPSAVVTGVLNSSMSDRFACTGGSPPGTWRVPAGTLPRGLCVAGDGVISGTPRQAGVFPFTLEARDAAGAVAFAAASVVVLAAPPAVPMVLGRALPVAFVDVPYAAHLTTTGGVPGYAWAALDPLPTGLALSAAGVVSGTPAVAGTFTFRVRVTDSTAANATAVISLVVVPHDRYLNGSITPCRITIPWKKHDQGDPSSDRVRLTATFDLPDRVVLDQYAKLVVFVADYPISFNRPTMYKFNSFVAFSAGKTGLLKGAASLRRLANNRVQVTMNVSKAPMADVLAPFGIGHTGAASAIVPIRIQVNDCATDTRTILLNYKLTGSTGVLKSP